jgi:hypothetical protein
MSDLDMMRGEVPQKPDDHEAAMARADLYECANYSFKLFKMIQEGQELEGWVQAKITKAADYIASVYHYMEYEMKFNDYGKQLEDSDIYTESVKQQFIQRLTEARVKLEKLKAKNIADLEESDSPGEKAWKDRVARQDPSQQRSMKDKARRFRKQGYSLNDKGDWVDSQGKPKYDTSESVTEGSGPKEKQKTPYRDINSPEYRAAADKKKQQMAKDKAAEPGKKLADKAKSVKEALKGGQKKLDVNKNGKLDGGDFAALRASKKKEESVIAEKAKNPYAVGMAQAMKSTGDKPPLKKSTITKAHDIAKSVKKTSKD